MTLPISPVFDILKASDDDNMLFLETSSNVKFVCPDGVIPVHKNIQAASSPYFNAAFDGSWQESTSGELTTTCPSHVIPAILTMIYTGDINLQLIDEDPLAFMKFATE